MRFVMLAAIIFTAYALAMFGLGMFILSTGRIPREDDPPDDTGQDDERAEMTTRRSFEPERIRTRVTL